MTDTNNEVYTGEVKKYKVLQPIDFFDEAGAVNGTHQVGEVVEIPAEIGDVFVSEGKAEVFVEENAEVASETAEVAEGAETASSENLE